MSGRGEQPPNDTYRPRKPIFRALSRIVERFEPAPRSESELRLERIAAMQPVPSRLRAALLQAALIGVLAVVLSKLIGFEGTWGSALGNGALLAVIVLAVLTARVVWRHRRPQG